MLAAALLWSQPSPGCPPALFCCASLQDVATQVQFWKLLLCDTAFYTPGSREAQEVAKGGTVDPGWYKYRNLVVR